MVPAIMEAELTSRPSSIKTRFLIISDTHNIGPAPSDYKHAPYREPLPSADVLLHAGDITMTGRVSEYYVMIDALSKSDAELKLVIAGNHDTTLDWKYYDRYGSNMHPGGLEDKYAAWCLWHSQYTRNCGIVYLEEGTHTFTLKTGARFTIYASPYQPEFCNWAFGYEHDEDRFNEDGARIPFGAVNPVPSFPEVDIMMTHGPPFQRLDMTATGEEVGCPHLLRAAQRCRPKLHCFGHIHEAWGAERVQWKSEGDQEDLHKSPGIKRVEYIEVDQEKALEERAVHVDISSEGGHGLVFGEETLLVNAAIMNRRYRPVQSPWLVLLDLPMPNGPG